MVHDTLRLLYQGLLSVLPGEGDVPVYLVTADVVAAAAVALLDGGSAGRFVHACPPAAHSATLDGLLDLAMNAFRDCPDFCRRRPVAPPYCARDAFELLVAGLRRHGGSLSDQVVGSVHFPERDFVIPEEVQRNSAVVPGAVAAAPVLAQKIILG